MNTHRIARKDWNSAGRVIGVLCFLVFAELPGRSVAQGIAIEPHAMAGPLLVGTGSCTAAGCHGGGHADNVVGSEYNVWISRDPHAQAYSVLFNERSQQMVRQLDKLPAGARVSAENDRRCLTCHSQVLAPARDPLRDVVSDGVGCESCHGPASEWLATHYVGRFGGERPSPAELASQGLWNTKNLLSRAQICAGCHVGGPGRDVNHDLIAAGHPRLQFEMSAFLAAMPKHWDETAERNERGSDFDAVVWATGQAATSQAALGQLADRAEKGKTWPEFAEWSCSACHHDLRDDGERQAGLAKSGGLSGRVMPWDTWNHRTLQYHAADISRAFGLNDDLGSSIESKLKTINDQMGGLSPNRQRAATDARDAASVLQAWAARLEHQRFGQPGLDLLSQAIVVRQLDGGMTDWSTAAQTYDALANLQQSRLVAAPHTHDQLTAAIRGIFDELDKRERTPKGYVYRPEQLRERLQTVYKLLPATEGEQ